MKKMIKIKKKIIALMVVVGMLITMSPASIFAQEDAFGHDLSYALSQDKTYATITLKLMPTNEISYVSIKDTNNIEERLGLTDESIQREYKVTENKEYSLQITYKENGTEKQEELKISVTGIKAVRARTASTSTASPIPESACTIGADGIITRIDLSGLTDKVNIVIPASVGGIRVTGIRGINDWTCVFGDGADKNAINSIELPDTITSIGSTAFYYCKNIQTIDIPNGVTSIGESAFIGCENLQTIDIPDGLTSIESYTFSGCKKLQNIIIPDGVTSIGNGAFQDCKKLQTINIPSNLISIGDEAFIYCDELGGDLVFPETLTSIGARAFFCAYKVTSLKLPSSLKKLESMVFDAMEALTSVEFSEGLETIGGSAFKSCENLKSIDIPKSVTEIGSSAFENCTNLVSISVSENFVITNSSSPSAFSRCTNLERIMVRSEKDEYDDHMRSVVEVINGQSGKTLTRYLGHTVLEAKQPQMNSFGEQEYDLDDLISVPTVYKGETITSGVSTDFQLPVTTYNLTKRSRSGSTRLDTTNKKLYISADENSLLTLSATYEGRTVSTEITANPVALESITVKTNPKQVEYRDGDIFNPEGLVITMIYNSGEKRNVAYDDEKANFTFDLSKLKTGDSKVKVTYQGKQTTLDIEVLRKAVLANPELNIIEGIKESYHIGETVSFSAKGDQQDNLNPVKGDTRYVPVNWKAMETGNINNKGKASFTTDSMKAGKHTLSVTFQLEEYNGRNWIVKGTDIKEKTLILEEVINIETPDKPSNDEKTDITKPSNGENTSSNTKDTVITGDQTSIAMLLILMITAGTILTVVTRKKHNKI